MDATVLPLLGWKATKLTGQLHLADWICFWPVCNLVWSNFSQILNLRFRSTHQSTGVSVSIWTFFRGCYEAMSDLMKKIFYWKNILWPKRLQKNHFCSMYPPLASTTASDLLRLFLLIAHNISASVLSLAVIWLKYFV